MAQKTLKVQIDTAINAEASLKQLRELKKLQKEVGAGSADWVKLKNAIDDTEDSLAIAKGGATDWIDTLEQSGGPLAIVGKGINEAKIAFGSFNTALKASVIGLIAAAIGGLVAAFSQSEVAMKKLQPIFIALEKILGGIFRAMEPLLDVFIELAMDILPVVTKGIGLFYSGLVGLFTYIKEAGTGVAKVWKGIFTLDFDSVKEGVEQIKNSFQKTAEASVAAYARFNEGTKEATKTEKENAEERKKIAEEEQKKRDELAKQAEEKRKQQLEKRKKELDALIELEVSKENTSREKLQKLLQQRYELEIQGQNLSNAEKEKLRQENQKKIEEALKADSDAQQKAFQDRLKLFQDESKLEIDQRTANFEQAKVLYGETSKEARKAQDEIFKAQQQALEDEKNILINKGILTQEEKNRLASIAIEQQNLTTVVQAENKKRLLSDVDTVLKANEDLKKASDLVFEEKIKRAGDDLELQQQILNDRLLADEAFYQKQLAIEGLTNEQRKKIEADYTASKAANAQTQVEIDKKKTDAELQLLDAYAAGLIAVADVVGKNTAAGKALAVAASLISTYSAIAKQLSAFAGVPVPGYAIVQAVATGLVGFKAVADIIKTPVPTDTGATATDQPRKLAAGGLVFGKGGPKQDLVPAMLSNGESVINAKSTEMFKPLLSTINQIGGGRKFATGGVVSSNFSQQQAMNELNTALAGSVNQPIKTYVVATDMTSQQMFDRAQKSRSTL